MGVWSADAGFGTSHGRGRTGGNLTRRCRTTPLPLPVIKRRLMVARAVLVMKRLTMGTRRLVSTGTTKPTPTLTRKRTTTAENKMPVVSPRARSRRASISRLPCCQFTSHRPCKTLRRSCLGAQTRQSFVHWIVLLSVVGDSHRGDITARHLPTSANPVHLLIYHLNSHGYQHNHDFLCDCFLPGSVICVCVCLLSGCIRSSISACGLFNRLSWRDSRPLATNINARSESFGI